MAGETRGGYGGQVVEGAVMISDALGRLHPYLFEIRRDIWQAESEVERLRRIGRRAMSPFRHWTWRAAITFPMLELFYFFPWLLANYMVRMTIVIGIMILIRIVWRIRQ